MAAVRRIVFHTASLRGGGAERVFVLMEPRLARLLTGCGLEFELVGALVEHHGRRGPFRIDRESLARGLSADAATFLASLRQRLA